jgi:hypothetical protein
LRAGGLAEFRRLVKQADQFVVQIAAAVGNDIDD